MADFYEQESDIYLSRLVAMIEPIMIIGVGIVVGILVISVFLPMMNMYDAL
ncbi:MAG: type II secretion system F family protein [Peptostreptococcaceae bacterium]|nr:type II secretion system F family protein [Peptostreptococcaceae bacterium]